MRDTEKSFLSFAEKMHRENLAPAVIDTFRYYYNRLVGGESGQISEKDIDPVKKEDIAHLEDLSDFKAAGTAAMEKSVIIKLNGGLGTSMGLSRAKSLLEVKDGLSFLDITAKQVLSCRKISGHLLPLAFMNSFRTEEDTLKALAIYPDLPVKDIPLSFLQHKFPKVLQKDLSPATWPQNPSLEWNPPGHGDIYTALITSGMLPSLLSANIEYAFISNSDNLGATFDERILGYMSQEHLPFLMEVTKRTEADSKGGHLARLKEGGFTLREIAQCPEGEREAFQDISRFRYFNTNSIWVNLKTLDARLGKENPTLPLAMIVNPKTLDPRDKSTPPVFQIETAMGSAISIFKKAAAVCVPRSRFAPVKKCRDLLVVWSDVYTLTKRRELHRSDNSKALPLVDLDPLYYSKIDDLRKRFSFGAPSLVGCTSLHVKGDVTFGKDIVIKGQVVIVNGTGQPVSIADGTVIDKNLSF